MPTIARPFCVALFLLCSSVAAAGDITVSAAASLGNAFKEAAQAFEAQHPGSKVLLNTAASGALLQQMAKGAPVDVFASADQETMDQAQAQGLVVAASRRDFARNTLLLVQPAGSQLVLRSLKDLTLPAVTRVAIGNPASVPVGRYAQDALEAAKLWPQVNAKAVNTLNVRQSLDYVARGEVDAGFVYATDAALVPGKVTVAFRVPLQQSIRYPIATSASAANPGEASRFVAFILSPAGQAILARYGFLKP
jgi:molybdate transport system substrate-binding protein